MRVTAICTDWLGSQTCFTANAKSVLSLVLLFRVISKYIIPKRVKLCTIESVKTKSKNLVVDVSHCCRLPPREARVDVAPQPLQHCAKFAGARWSTRRLRLRKLWSK